MKSLKHYLAENEKSYEFRIRTVVEMSSEQLDKLEQHLMKYNVESVSAPKKTIMQKSPYGFAEWGPAEVYIFDITAKLPVTSNVLHEEISKATGLPMQAILVRNKLEDENISAVQEEPADSKSVLADADYSDSAKVKHDEYYGNGFVEKFVKNLPKTELSKEYKVK